MFVCFVRAPWVLNRRKTLLSCSSSQRQWI